MQLIQVKALGGVLHFLLLGFNNKKFHRKSLGAFQTEFLLSEDKVLKLLIWILNVR